MEVTERNGDPESVIVHVVMRGRDPVFAGTLKDALEWVTRSMTENMYGSTDSYHLVAVDQTPWWN